MKFKTPREAIELLERHNDFGMQALGFLIRHNMESEGLDLDWKKEEEETEEPEPKPNRSWFARIIGL